MSNIIKLKTNDILEVLGDDPFFTGKIICPNHILHLKNGERHRLFYPAVYQCNIDDESLDIRTSNLFGRDNIYSYAFYINGSRYSDFRHSYKSLKEFLKKSKELALFEHTVLETL